MYSLIKGSQILCVLPAEISFISCNSTPFDALSIMLDEMTGDKPSKIRTRRGKNLALLEIIRYNIGVRTNIT